MRFTWACSLVLATLTTLSAAAPADPIARDVVASEGEPLSKRPNFKILYEGDEDEPGSKAPLSKRPNFKILYRGDEDEPAPKAA
ncbi:hypothetical protein ABOM_002347 [Aspergillus bombycis]|uniref:Uncharacterized protein n=1 Tax=Aspergillus bombycis TaxID=109264 RepID=A0A1F8ABE1_9EURO|nr:hypothetical protein ABOM_002347 [Aspergillus bombycis]OGM49046.1 hypothetical protein ABOM_002347 [Aspergillus bombycis]